MFRRNKIEIDRKKDLYFRPIFPALVVLAASFVLIAVSFRTAQRDTNSQRVIAANENATFIESTVKQRFSIYEDTLRASNGFFLSSDTVTREEWKSFIQSLTLGERHPGIRGVGYVELVSAAEKSEFETSVRAEGLNEYAVYPEFDTDIYAAVRYLVPTAGQAGDDRSAVSLGFNMYSEPTRRSAFDAATVSGNPTLTEVFNLLTPSVTPLQGFYLVVPYYQKGAPINTQEDRKIALKGFFYAAFITDTVFSELFRTLEPAFGFSIYNKAVAPENKIYESNTKINQPEFNELKRNNVSMYGQDWIFVYKAREDFIPYSVRSRPTNVIVAGTIFSVSLAAIIYLLIQRRTRDLAYIEEKKLEAAKDELLSLASHQLRTPATAVKQYVSMVKDGFAGKLSTEQRKLLEKAYASNERQLTIVDDLLYVARLDSGQTDLHQERLDVTALINSVISDQKGSIKLRKQKVLFKKPSRNVYLTADPQYLRMIIENLLSNASKYSFDRTQIVIELKESVSKVTINITDKGVGIDEVDYQNVFLRFSRIPNELTRQTAGSGIGLYLAKQLALLHKGDITFTSTPGRGSTFTLTIPKRQQKKEV